MDTERATHLQWCKDRALEYVKAGRLEDAISSMQSDLTKHPDTNTPEIIKRAQDIELLYADSMHRRVVVYIHGFK
jgi:hypothetical protein